jgi:hypothetical protein
MQVVIFIDDSDDDSDVVRASCVILRSSGSGNTGGRAFQIQVAYSIDTWVV